MQLKDLVHVHIWNFMLAQRSISFRLHITRQLIVFSSISSICFIFSFLIVYESEVFSSSFSSVAQLCPTLFDPRQHARLPCPSPTPGACSNSCPSSRWCHQTISSSVVPFPSCLQSLLTSGSFPMSQFFASGGQSIEISVSTSVLPMNIQDWFPWG